MSETRVIEPGMIFTRNYDRTKWEVLDKDERSGRYKVIGLAPATRALGYVWCDLDEASYTLWSSGDKSEFRLTRVSKDEITGVYLWTVVNSAGMKQTEPVVLMTAAKIWCSLNNGHEDIVPTKALVKDMIVDLMMFRRNSKESLTVWRDEITDLIDTLLDMRASQLGI